MPLDLSKMKKPEDDGSGANSGGGAHFFTVTESNLESSVIGKSAEVPVVVMIGTPRSPASENLKSSLTDIAGSSKGKFVVGYVDADATPQVAQTFGVRELPTTLAIAAGRPLTSFAGEQPKEALQQWVDTLVEKIGPQLRGPSDAAADGEEDETPPDPRIAAAEQQLVSGDIAGAIETYDQVLADDPDNTPVKQARDSAALIQRANSEQPAEDDEVGQALHNADMSIVRGDVEGAFNGLIRQIGTTAGDDRERLKNRLFDLFDLFESQDPRVLAARRDLASALF